MTDRTSWSRLRVLATVVVAAVGATAAGVAGSHAQGAADGGLLVRAEFADASPILVGNDVKVDGVPVGEVAGLDVRDGRALVAMFLEPAALPVYGDARFTIRPVSLLGERFVDLDRGSPAAAPLRTGDLVGADRTATNTDLDEILNALDDPTGPGLAMLLTTLGQGLDGNGADADATIRALAPALTDTAALAETLSAQNALLSDLVETMDPVAGALAADDGRRLDELVSTAEDLLSATAQQQAQIEATLAELPATLTSARITLDRVTAVADSTTPTLAGLRPVTGDLERLSTELTAFADALDPALAATEPVLARGRDLLTEAGPVVAALRGAGPDLRATTAGARPIVADLTANLGDVYDFIRFWALTANGNDALSSYFRGFVVVNPQSMTGLLPQGLQDVPLPGATESGTGAAPALPVPGSAPPGGLLVPDRGGSGPTGLDAEQEAGIVDFLLGGDR